MQHNVQSPFTQEELCHHAGFAAAKCFSVGLLLQGARLNFVENVGLYRPRCPHPAAYASEGHRVIEPLEIKKLGTKGPFKIKQGADRTCGRPSELIPAALPLAFVA